VYRHLLRHGHQLHSIKGTLTRDFRPRKFEAIFEKALICVSRTQGKLFDGKNKGRKSRVRVSLKGQCHEIFDSRFFSSINPFESRENRKPNFFSEFPNFFCLQYRYNMGMLNYETFLLDVLFKKKLRPHKDDLNFRGVTISAGSLTPRKFRITLHKLLH
jgi:hypothetical protein